MEADRSDSDAEQSLDEFQRPTSPGRSRNMAAIRRRDTSPERNLRSLLHAAGLRYRVDYPLVVGGLRVRPDIVFTKARVAIFVDGCFWHGCPQHYKEPRVNPAYWKPKIAANIARDRLQEARLGEAGWTVLRFWEHQDPVETLHGVCRALAQAKGP